MNEKGIKKLRMKIISVFLALALVFGSIPMIAQAKTEEVQYVDTVSNSVPLRKGPYKTSEIAWICDKGTVLKYERALCNNLNHSWYIVEYRGSDYYVYSENVTKHKCDYTDITYNGVTYEYCDCSKINVLETTTISVKRANTVASYATTAAVSASADGVLPAGDVIAAVILVIAAADSVLNGVSEDVIDVAKEISLEEVLDEENTCTDVSFRKVAKVKGVGKLTYVDKECMDVLQAFFYARFVGDIYTKYRLIAYEVASLYGDCFSERDAERPEYWFHYHFGKDHNDSVGYHMFYGSNDYGEVPVEPLDK